MATGSGPGAFGDGTRGPGAFGGTPRSIRVFGTSPPSSVATGGPPMSASAVVSPKAPGFGVSSNGYLTFQGKAFTGGGDPVQFNVLCGDKPPTITDGYAIWNEVPRPLARSATIFAGYNPAKMTVDIRFGIWDSQGWHTDDDTGRNVEGHIEQLEWMAGVNQPTGPPPVVFVRSINAHGHSTHLIPFNFQESTWIVQGIDWGDAIRNPSAYRIYQDCTVSLTNYLGLAKAPKQTTSQHGGWFVSRHGADSPLSIASTPSELAPIATRETLAREIMHDPRNKRLKLRSIRQKVKHGVKVWVPPHSV